MTAKTNPKTGKKRKRPPLEQTAKEVNTYLKGGFSGIWLLTQDPADAVALLMSICRAYNWPCIEWEAANGPHLLWPQPDKQALQDGLLTGHPAEKLHFPETRPEAAPPNGIWTPQHAINWVARQIIPRLAQGVDGDGSTDYGANRAMLLLHYPQRFWENPAVVQAVHTTLQAAKTGNLPLVIVALSSSLKLVEEIDKDFVIVDHALPTRIELKTIAEGVDAEVYQEAAKDKNRLRRVLDAAVGLARSEAESAFALSVARYRKLSPTAVWDYKAQAVKKSAALTLYKGDASFAELGGLEQLKKFALKLLDPNRDTRNPDLRALGLLLLGVPGTGKSQWCKALGNATKRLMVQLDMGAIYGGIVGASEENLRQAMRAVDALAPCILFVDEIEKGLSGLESSGKTDSGVAARVFGSLLTWLSDHTTDVFFVGTCNDMSKLPAAFSRSERFDSIFFMDLPTKAQRSAIWQIYLKKFGIAGNSQRPDDTNWTGAEIRSCCRLSAMMQVPLIEAAETVNPVAVTAKEQITELRQWAVARALSTEKPGPFRLA